jgi:medium-chain acyl-[acyl-carrier-protein] hydrolase
VRLPAFIRSLPVGDRAVPLGGDDGPLPEAEAAELERRFEVRRSDLDVVNHVNNTCYVGWAVESVPDAVWESHHPAALEILFQKEARYGESVLARTRSLDGAAGLRFAHELRGPGDTVLVRAVTRWDPSS